MSRDIQTGGSLFAPIFSFLNSYLKDKKENLIPSKDVAHFDKVLQQLSFDFQDWTKIKIEPTQNSNQSYQKACQAVALRFLIIDTNIYEKLIDFEECEKVLQLYNRKQFNSKILKQLLMEFTQFYHYFKMDLQKHFENIFTLLLLEELEIQAIEEVNKRFIPLKKVIEKIASGILADCYLQTSNNSDIYNLLLIEPLNLYVQEKYQYDFNACYSLNSNNCSYLFSSEEQILKSNHLLQLALLQEHSFWEKNKYFNIVQFLNYVHKLNSFKHAQKIIDYIFLNLFTIPNCQCIIKNNFALCYAMKEDVIEAFDSRTRMMFSRILQNEKEIAILKQESFCYPLIQVNDNVKEKLKQGKCICLDFIQTYLYPHDYQNFYAVFFKELDSVNTTENWTKATIHSGFLLDKNLGWMKDADRLIFKAYCPDAFITENILNRIYLKAYAAKQAIKDTLKTYQFLHKIFFDCIEYFAKKYSIFTAQQLDSATREDCYNKLKESLRYFHIQPREEYKQYYITALLDRDIATLQECEHFAMLEQLGDAIYNFVVAELLFYTPNHTSHTKSFHSKYDYYIQAKAQILISKKFVFDKAYFALEWIEQTAQKEKYLADSLEMIIGAISLDLGIEVALQFVKTLLQETFNDDFKEPLYFSTLQLIDIDASLYEYAEKIIPTMLYNKHNEYNILLLAVDKLILALILGTDTEEKRRTISFNLASQVIYGKANDCFRINWLLYYYLKDGILPTIDRYKEIILTNFNNHNKEI